MQASLMEFHDEYKASKMNGIYEDIYGEGYEYERVLFLTEQLHDLLEEYIGDCRGWNNWVSRAEPSIFKLVNNNKI